MKDINLINKKELCVLKLSKDKRNVYLEYIPIVPDKNISEKLKQFDLDYKSNSNSILFLIEFIEKNLSELLDAFSYCISLKVSYQQLPANGHAYFVTRHSELIKQLSDIPPDKTDRIEIVKNDISDLRTKFHSYIHRRFNAFNIAQAYKICENNTDILSFSHRRIGWTKPIYSLTPNFAFEIKTNFGYGHVSYFFTKLIYKGIEIIPFSEWVMYPHADFSEIIRYSKKHNLDDKDWYFALTYAKDACNLSLTNEQAFVDKYIMSECDKMINELESILNKNEFNYHLEHVKSDEKGFRIEPETQKIVLAGHELIEFRGEKISGALNFIEKILSFEKVRSMNAFIDRIKKLNLKILPVLQNEIPLINSEIINLQSRLAEIKGKLAPMQETYHAYNKKSQDFVYNNAVKKTFDEKKELQDKFISLNPDFKQFLKEFTSLNNEHNDILKQLNALETTNRKINSYIGTIQKYFKSTK